MMRTSVKQTRRSIAKHKSAKTNIKQNNKNMHEGGLPQESQRLYAVSYVGTIVEIIALDISIMAQK